MITLVQSHPPSAHRRPRRRYKSGLLLGRPLAGDDAEALSAETLVLSAAGQPQRHGVGLATAAARAVDRRHGRLAPWLEDRIALGQTRRMHRSVDATRRDTRLDCGQVDGRGSELVRRRQLLQRFAACLALATPTALAACDRL